MKAFLHLTNECNCKCKYCFESQNNQKMSLSIAKDTVSFILKNKNEGITPSLIFFGGEPLLQWDNIIVPLTNYINKDKKEKFNLSITTNGILLDENKLNFMLNNNIKVLLSVDGDKMTQDYNRPLKNNLSSFDILQNKFPLILQYFPNTIFRSTLIPETIQYLFHNINYAKNQGFKFFFITPNQFQIWSDKEKDILKKEFRKYSNYFINSFKNNKIPILFTGFQKNFKDIQKINSRIISPEKNICKNCKRCGLGLTNSIAIGVKGNIFACQELASESKNEENPFWIGDIYKGINEERKNKLIKLFDIKKKKSYFNCDECRLKTVCNSGCIANNYLISKDINYIPEMYCWWEQFLLDEAIYILNSFNNNMPPLFIKYWQQIFNK